MHKIHTFWIGNLFQITRRYSQDLALVGASDLLKIFCMEEIFSFWLAISEIIKVKSPIVSPLLILFKCTIQTPY